MTTQIMNRIYDPWSDAALLAVRGNSPHNRLVIVLGAGWCSKCQEFKAAFIKAVAHMPSQYLPVWLDLEEHADFLGDYVPEELPELLIYRSTKLVQRAFLARIEQLNESLHAPGQAFPIESYPQIASALMQQNWCEEEDGTACE